MKDPNDVIKLIMKQNNVSQVDVAKLFGVSSQAINNKFRRGTWDIDEVVKLLEFMNCTLIAVSNDTLMYKF